MDEFGTGGERPRQRFTEKATQAGFHNSIANWREDLVSYSLDTLALVWPEEAYAFYQVIVKGRQIIDVAAEAGVSERAIRRRLVGHDGKLGAEDWMLIILQLYREADCVRPSGAEAVRDCFLTSDWGEASINSSLRVFFWTLLEAAAGSECEAIINSLPWRAPEAPRTLAWPCYTETGPLAHSLLPGLLAALQGAQNLTDRLRLAILSSFIHAKHRRVWNEALNILNTGGCRTVAERGQIPHAHLRQAETNSQLLLSNSQLLGANPAPLQCGILGVLSCTPMSWEELCEFVDDAALRGVSAAERLDHCAQFFFAGGL